MMIEQIVVFLVFALIGWGSFLVLGVTNYKGIIKKHEKGAVICLVIFTAYSLFLVTSLMVKILYLEYSYIY